MTEHAYRRTPLPKSMDKPIVLIMALFALTIFSPFVAFGAMAKWMILTFDPAIEVRLFDYLRTLGQLHLSLFAEARW